ncbi:es2 protein, putative [Pediculus humanus corporis]|uniref:Es2 protein, putative n=1 Tax=Pediculus humanus subsp. corporis TaxID=121224 RepID=E0W3M7_PEDHC|nr:es2 protein, putative [Pediculus humanus corporis]EEB20233.1 es2 protein, putative [Pediculus humanus corporis]
MKDSKIPGEKALGVMKVNTELGLFKVPKTPLKKKQKVLEEETYLEEMGKIIQRDFFPDLMKLKAQNEYLDAQSQNDSEKMMQIYYKYSSGKRPPTERVPSPATFETPVQPKLNNDCVEEANLENDLEKGGQNSSSSNSSKKLSLDQYLASHTSEDNESFKEMHKESIVKHKLKYSWLYQNEGELNKSIEDSLKVPSIEDQASGKEKPLSLTSWTYKNQNYCMYVPEGVDLTVEEKNEMMRKKHEIVHENTRLTKNPFDEQQNKDVIHELAMNQARTQEGKIGVDGKIVTCVETPKVNGFSFVRTPSPMPGVNESPIITWGEIEGTPFRLDGSDTPYSSSSGPTFRIPEIPKREKLAMALADKASESYRDKKRKAIEAARSQLSGQTPKRQGSCINRINEMSPAAQRLASASLGQRLNADSALRNSYSPSPKSSRSSPYFNLTPKTPRTPKTPVTPMASPNAKLKHLVRRATPVSVTDDLLKLPRIGNSRPKASDFF